MTALYTKTYESITKNTVDEISFAVEEFNSATVVTAKRSAAIDLLRAVQERQLRFSIRAHGQLLPRIIRAIGSYTKIGSGSFDPCISYALTGIMYFICFDGRNVDIVERSSIRTLLSIIHRAQLSSDFYRKFIVDEKYSFLDTSSSSNSNTQTIQGQSKLKNRLLARRRSHLTNVDGLGDTSLSFVKRIMYTQIQNSYSTDELINDFHFGKLKDDYDPGMYAISGRLTDDTLIPPSSHDLALLTIFRCVCLSDSAGPRESKTFSSKQWSRRYIEQVSRLKEYIAEDQCMGILCVELLRAGSEIIALFSHERSDLSSQATQLSIFRLLLILQIIENLCFMSSKSQNTIALFTAKIRHNQVSVSATSMVLDILHICIEYLGRDVNKTSPENSEKSDTTKKGEPAHTIMKRSDCATRSHFHSFAIREIFGACLRVLMNISNDCDIGIQVVFAGHGYLVLNSKELSTREDIDLPQNPPLSGITTIISATQFALTNTQGIVNTVSYFDEAITAIGILTNCVETNDVNREEFSNLIITTAEKNEKALIWLAQCFCSIAFLLDLPALPVGVNGVNSDSNYDVATRLHNVIGIASNDTPEISPSQQQDTKVRPEDLFTAAYLALFLGCVCQHSNENRLLIYNVSEFKPCSSDIFDQMLRVLRAFTTLQLNAGVLTAEFTEQILKIGIQIHMSRNKMKELDLTGNEHDRYTQSDNEDSLGSVCTAAACIDSVHSRNDTSMMSKNHEASMVCKNHDTSMVSNTHGASTDHDCSEFSHDDTNMEHSTQGTFLDVYSPPKHQSKRKFIRYGMRSPNLKKRLKETTFDASKTATIDTDEFDFIE